MSERRMVWKQFTDGDPATAVFLETAGWCNDQSLPLCQDCDEDHPSYCRPCADIREEDRQAELAEDRARGFA